MGIRSDKNTALREALRHQRKLVFGHYRYWFHIAIWLLVIAYTVFNYRAKVNTGRVDFSDGLSISSTGTSTNLELAMTFRGVLAGSIMAAVMVYFYLLLVIPYARYKLRKKYLLLGLFVNAALWLAVMICSGIVVSRSESPDGHRISSAGVFAIYLCVLSVVLSAYFFAIYYFIDLYEQQKNLRHYEAVLTAKVQAETSFLKTQINPHFLFNTLNNIYSLTLARSADAAHIARQLKALIAYMTQDCTQDLVPLAGELNFLRNYIALEELRNRREQARIDLEVAGSPEQLQIAPLLLINFVENAFKHGVKAGIERSFVHIVIRIAGRRLYLDVANSLPRGAGSGQAVRQDGGIGIGNVRRRLELLYPQRHQLRIERGGNTFSVHLSISL